MASFTTQSAPTMNPTPPMSTGQQHTALQTANTAKSLFGKATSFTNSGIGELNKVKGELTQDANVWKQGAIGNLRNFKGKMDQKKLELQQKADQMKAQHAQNMAEASADLAQGGIHARFGKGVGWFKKKGDEAQVAYDDAMKPGGKVDQAKAEFNRGKAEAEAKALQGFKTDPVNPVQMQGQQDGAGRRRRRRKSRRKKKSKKKRGRKSRKKKRKRKTRKKRRRRNRKKSRRRRRR
jgi:hypothetical protein